MLRSHIKFDLYWELPKSFGLIWSALSTQKFVVGIFFDLIDQNIHGIYFYEYINLIRHFQYYSGIQ